MESSLPAEANFSAELVYLPVFNLALQQNAFPVVSELKLINHLGHGNRWWCSPASMLHRSASRAPARWGRCISSISSTTRRRGISVPA